MISLLGLDSGAPVEHLITYLCLRDTAARWNAAREPDIAADGRTTADGDAAKNGGASVDDNIILYDGMPYITLYQCTMFV